MGASTRIVPVFYRKMWNGSSVMMQCIYNVGLPDLMTICCPVGLKIGKEQTSLFFLINMLKEQADLEDCNIEKCKIAYVERYLDDGSSASGCARHSVAGVSLNRKPPYPTDTDAVAKFL